MLVACWCLDDEERRDGLYAELRAIDAGFLSHWGWCDPPQLARKRDELLERLHRAPGDDDATSDAVIAAANAYLLGAPRALLPAPE